MINDLCRPKNLSSCMMLVTITTDHLVVLFRFHNQLTLARSQREWAAELGRRQTVARKQTGSANPTKLFFYSLNLRRK